MTTSLPPFSHLWKEAWQRFGANNNLMLSIGALAAVPFVALSFMPAPKTLPSLALFIGLVLVAALWSALASMAIYASAAHPEIKTLRDAFRLGGTRWFGFVTTQLLEGLAILVPVIILIGALVAISFSALGTVGFENAEKLGAGTGLTTFSLLLIGGVLISFWALRLTFSGFIVFSENKKNLAAFRSSFALTKGRVFELWRKFFIFGLCVAGISIAISIVANISTGSLNENSPAYQMIQSLFGLISNMIIIPLETLFIAALYHALRSSPQESTINT